MISILIPVYNQYVVSLVDDLIDQCKNAKVGFQILVFDDGSDPSIKIHNEPLHNKMGVNYIEMSENLGRSRIRNRLASTAMYPNLLFLDGDSKIDHPDFINRYLGVIGQYNIISGGRIYQKEKPDDKYLLHWTYGHRRESLSTAMRSKEPYLNFHSNNFLIKTKIAEDIGFDETLQGYGYEDLLLAERFENAGYTVAHIDNPVIHDGLEETEVFLHKTENAIQNLVKLNHEGKIQNTRLTAFYRRSNRYGIFQALKMYYGHNEENILQNLKSNNPSMRNFSLWKLMKYHQYLQELSKKN